jgi:hypothetical protein
VEAEYERSQRGELFRGTGCVASEPRRELRPRSCSDKAGEAGDRGGCWVGVDDLNVALSSGVEPLSLIECWSRLVNVKAPLLCAALSRTGESSNRGDCSDRV